MAFLSSEGAGSFLELTDLEDGPTLSQLLTLNIEAGRLSLSREKAQVNATVIALTSILDSKILDSFNKSIDEALEATDVLGAKKGKSSVSTGGKKAGGTSDVKSPGGKKAAVARTMAELNKLNSLLGG